MCVCTFDAHVCIIQYTMYVTSLRFSGGREAGGVCVCVCVCVCAHLMHVYTLQCVLLLYASKLIQAMVPYLDKIHLSDGPRWTKQTTLLHLQNEGVYIYT